MVLTHPEGQQVNIPFVFLPPEPSDFNIRLVLRHPQEQTVNIPFGVLKIRATRLQYSYGFDTI